MASRVAKLVCVSANNHNKYYNMIESGANIHVEYGRVGQSKCCVNYPAFKWNSLYKAKLRKGYKDVTEYHVVSKSVNFTAITNDAISAIVAELQALAKNSIAQNYTVGANIVTQAQIDEAQRLIDTLATPKITEHQFDSLLLEIYKIIPRRMKRVQDNLLSSLKTHEKNSNYIIAKEQATLDVMKGQVRVNTAQQENKEDDSKTILEAMGLNIQVVDKDEANTIRKELGELENKYLRAFKVLNIRTENKFNSEIETAKNKTTKLFWHGSRSENWWSILDSGLLIRPTNVAITGAMFGQGIYFADKAKKSYGYTSCQGSYWARGNSSKGFMSLYNVHLGNSLVLDKREYWAGNLTEQKLKERGDYDSLTALRGADLYNNEYVIYRDSKATIQYLVEVS